MHGGELCDTAAARGGHSIALNRGLALQPALLAYRIFLSDSPSSLFALANLSALTSQLGLSACRLPLHPCLSPTIPARQLGPVAGLADACTRHFVTPSTLGDHLSEQMRLVTECSRLTRQVYTRGFPPASSVHEAYCPGLSCDSFLHQYRETARRFGRACLVAFLSACTYSLSPPRCYYCLLIYLYPPLFPTHSRPRARVVPLSLTCMTVYAPTSVHQLNIRHRPRPRLPRGAISARPYTSNHIPARSSCKLRVQGGTFP